MNALTIIPARLAARRLPGKPLAEIGGIPMIVRVMRCAQAADVGPVIVAAGDVEIAEVITAAGGRAVLTDPALPSGSDRILAALAQVDPEGRYDAVVNLQGDMPFVSPEVIIACANLLATQPACDISTCIAPELSAEDRVNPDVVKAVVSLNGGGACGKALYFTRSALYGDAPIWRHIGIYAYRRDALATFTGAPPSALERREGLEQLRALELGLSIWASVVPLAPLSVDTPADLASARDFAARLEDQAR